jgi:hypothetical protein
MTKEQVMKLPEAELDDLVARHVFKMKQATGEYANHWDSTEFIKHVPEPIRSMMPRYLPIRAFKPSTEPVVAIALFIGMKALGYMLFVACMPNGWQSFACPHGQDGFTESFESETLPLALCRASLIALLCEPPANPAMN